MNWHLYVIVAGFLLVPNLGVYAQGQITVNVIERANPPSTFAAKPKASSLYVERGTVEKPFRWVKPGGDPCNPKGGCTLGWALDKSGWPEEVKRMLTIAVGTPPKLVTITKGWEGWMTWGKYSPKFERHTRAEFEQVIPTHEWSVAYEGTRYHLIRPFICKNWGGYTRQAEWSETLVSPSPPAVAETHKAAPAQPPLVAGPTRPPLGQNPGLGGVVCVDDDPA